VAADGSEGIFRRAWPAAGEPRASVVIAHGAGEHSGRYEHVAKRLTAAGYATYALDHMGHGRSDGKPALIEMDTVVLDLGALIADVRAEDPERPLFLLGHSMGGCISLEYACRHQEEIEGLILSSPAISLEAAPAPMRALSKALSAVLPGLGVYEVDSEAVSRDPEVVRAYDTDPLVHHGKLPVRTVAELTRSVESFPGRVGELRLPLLLFHGTGDRIVPRDGTEMVAERAGSEDKTLELFDGLYHETLNEPEQDEVLDLVVGWLDERSAS
jgi:acylglycerol lipase